MSTRKRILLILAKEELKMAIWFNAEGFISLYESSLQRAKRLIEQAEEIS
jgi:hypothetical protein